MAHRFSSSCVRGPAESHAYWRDVGTLDAYFDANLDVLSPAGGIDLLDPDWPLWTEGLELPLFRFGRDRERLAPDCRVQRSMLFEGVRLDNRSQVEDSLILPNARVGAGARLNRVIVDSGTHIPAGLAIGEDPDFDAMHFRRTEKGVCLVTQAMIDQLPELLPLRSAA